MKAFWNHPLVAILTYPFVLIFCIVLTPFAWLWDKYTEHFGVEE